MFCGYTRGTEYSVPCRATDLGCDGHCSWHCPYGLALNNRLMGFHLDGTPHSLIHNRYMKELEKWEDHCIECHGLPDNRPKTTHTGNGAFQGAFAFTLTKSPDDDLTELDMIKAVRKIMSQKSCPVKKYAWYLEYGDPELKAHPHIHGLYETESSGRIEAKHWKRSWKIWDEKHKLGKGFRGGYHRPVRSEEGYSDYIKKDKGLNESFGLEKEISGYGIDG